jgi:membrane fusion protein, multidrug efflux system
MQPAIPVRVAVSVMVACALLGACSGKKPAAAPAAPPPAQVSVVTLKPRTVTLTRELPGRTSPFLVAEVRPQVGGIVKKRLFTEGGAVRAGQPLYELDDSTYQADVASARAALARAEATLNSAKLNASRSAELARIDAVSRQDNENAIAALRQAEADVAAARAALERASVVLGYARIVSPITGRIGKSAVTQGALVTANQAVALATVQQLDPMYVDLTQSSSELLQLRKQIGAGTAQPARGLPVVIVMEDGSRYPHPGKLAFSDVTVDPTTGSYLLRVVVPNPESFLLPGMYVRAVVGNAVRDDAILVPQVGIARDPKGNATAMVLGADGKVQARSVKVSQTVGDQWLVESGLDAGDKVIVSGLQKVRPGAPAEATEAPPPGSAPAKGAGAAGARPAPARK